MRLGTILIVLTSLWLFTGTASATQLRLLDRPLPHPLVTQLPPGVLAGAGGDAPVSKTSLRIGQSVASFLVNGAALALTVGVGRSLMGEHVLIDVEWVSYFIVLGGTAAVTGLLSTVAVAITSSVMGHDPSFGRMLGWTLVARLGMLVVSGVFMQFLNPRDGMLLFCLGTGLGVLGGGVLDVVLAQPPSTPPVAPTGPATASNGPGGRVIGLPLFAMQF